MISKEDFIEIYKSLEDYNNTGERFTLNPVLNFDRILGLLNSGWSAINLLLGTILEKDGVDWVNWWMFEKPNFKNADRVTDADSGEIIPTETLDDLWNLVKDYRK